MKIYFVNEMLISWGLNDCGFENNAKNLRVPQKYKPH